MRKIVLLTIICCWLPRSAARAEVADSAASGFTIKQTFSIKAEPEAVYHKLFRVGDWWDSAHTFSGDAKNLSIEEKAPGCWCEKLPNGGSIRHMEVVAVMPGTRLVLIGGLGPLQSIAASGSMTIQVSASQGVTTLQVTYAVAGYFPAGLNTLASPVDSVLSQQFVRLKNYIESGSPAPPK
jgi:hypothetical protein